MVSLCLLLHVWSLLSHENLSFNKHMGKEFWEGEIIGIVENSVIAVDEKLHCTYLDGTEDVAWDNSNHCSRNLI